MSTNIMVHVDAMEIMLQSIQKEIFSRFQPSTYAGHVGLAAANPL